MGIIRPPWIDKDWFYRYIFNYCDHFGDKAVLSKFCVICRQEVERLEKYRLEGKDPYDPKNVFQEVADDLRQTFILLQKDLDKWGIDIDSLPDPPEDNFSPNRFRIYQMTVNYSRVVKRIVHELNFVIPDSPHSLTLKCLDILLHSQSYCVAKIGRALFSRHEEQQAPEDLTAHDSETSALLAYLAIHRNARTLKTISAEKKFPPAFQKRLIRYSNLSYNFAKVIQDEFFPNYKIDLSTEIGVD